MLFFMMTFRFSVLLQLSSCTYVYNYFSENARIKFSPIDADVSGVELQRLQNIVNVYMSARKRNDSV